MAGTQETQRTQIDTQRSQYEVEDMSHLNARLVSRNPMYPNIDLPKGITTYHVGRKPRINDIVMPQDWKRISGQHCVLNYQEHTAKDDLVLGISDPDPIIWIADSSQSGTFVRPQDRVLSSIEG
ncbi:hypothetical protein RSAG8_10422, partial [Rhizoctonia solani AG-8 WAC10335]